MNQNKEYIEATDWLFQQFPSYQIIGSKAFKPTLDNSIAITKFLGNPQDELKFIHVAGSNGKGSTCSMLASILTESGYKVGLFTSPHIKDYRERIRVNGKCIPEKDVVDFVQLIRKNSFSFSPSFFEVTFGLALNHFKQEQCDYCIIETGLGGRLDATNIINPILSVITTISLEHTQLLGNSISEIATEKAGIIKENKPLVLGSIKSEALEVIEKVVRQWETKIEPYSNKWEPSQFNLPILGEYQKDNFKTVLNALEVLTNIKITISQESIQKGLDNLTINTGFYGRFQIVSKEPTIIYDVSHNPDGIEKTLVTIKQLNRGELHIIYGTSSDKDILSIFEILPENSHYYFTEFASERCAKIEDLKTLAQQDKFQSAFYFNSAMNALNHAKSRAEKNDTIVVIGSFFLISDFY